MNVKSSLIGPIAPQNTSRTFFFIFCHFYPDSTFIENVEETLKIKEYFSPGYYIDLLSINLWKKNKFRV